MKAVTICARCGTSHTRASQRYCNDCHAAYMREWRKTHPLSDEAKRRDTARSYAGVYKRRGKQLQPQPCLCCGAADAEMHHPDHEKPLVVVWLCRPCHLSWHAFWREAVMSAWEFWSEKLRNDMQKHTQKPPRETFSEPATAEVELVPTD